MRPSKNHPVLLMLLLGLLLLIPASSRADTITSHNWSGYAVHGNGARFRHVVASWRQPAGSCPAGQSSYSAFWIGIGGYRLRSRALEQIGSELDCTGRGSTMYAWYELVPAAATAIPITVRGGDLLTASVTVSGHRVTLALRDSTRNETFAKTIHARAVDMSSAEWIAEAPSDCSVGATCRPLPLANFGQVRFGGATAETTSRRLGAVASSLWKATRILLAPSASGASASSSANASTATPSVLQDRGQAFSISYSGVSARSRRR